MKPMSALWRLALTVAVGLLCLILLLNTIARPVAPQVRTYTAEFTDVSGLYAGADVRVRGVPGGKVDAIELQRRRGQSVAVVSFSLESRYGVVADTRIAIKFQSLTGSRYVDITDPAENYRDSDLVKDVPVDMTTPSFDVTTLFNGLQPVLSTLSPEEINTFTTNVATFLAGDGTGLGPILESMQTLTRFVADRQQVVSVLMQNLSTVAASMGSKSGNMIQILNWINRPLDGVLGVLDEFRKTELYSVDFLSPLQDLLTNAGFPLEGNSSGSFVFQNPEKAADTNVTNINQGLDRAFANLDLFIDSMKLLPVMWDSIGPPAEDNVPLPCSRGRMQLPEQMDVLLNGQRVVLCNR